MNDVDRPNAGMPDEGRIAVLIYVLYLVSLLVGITALVGVIMAYVYRDDGPDWVRTHYRFQIRTFWIGLLLTVISIVLTVVVIGFLLLALVALWIIIRAIKGMRHALRGEPYPNPATWMF